MKCNEPRTTCPSREEFAKELFNSLGGCVIKETTGYTIYDRWVMKFGKDNSGHAGDCTVYSSMQNNRITDGICTCGYGHRQQTSESFAMDNMYSQERISEGLERKDNSGITCCSCPIDMPCDCGYDHNLSKKFSQQPPKEPCKHSLIVKDTGYDLWVCCHNCDLDIDVSYPAPKEWKVSLEEIKESMKTHGGDKLEEWLLNIMSESILSLLNATEERKGAE